LIIQIDIAEKQIQIAALLTERAISEITSLTIAQRCCIFHDRTSSAFSKPSRWSRLQSLMQSALDTCLDEITRWQCRVCGHHHAGLTASWHCSCEANV